MSDGQEPMSNLFKGEKEQGGKYGAQGWLGRWGMAVWI